MLHTFRTRADSSYIAAEGMRYNLCYTLKEQLNCMHEISVLVAF